MRRTKTIIAESHELLDVARNSPKEEIKRKFNAIIKKHHPDLKEAHEKSKHEEASKIYIDAYKLVSDEEFMAKVEAFESGKIGKNQPCYCESEEKFKHCCGK